MSELRKLPQIDALAASKVLAGYPAGLRSRAARAAVSAAREAIRQGAPFDPERLETEAADHARRLSRTSLNRVINGAGVILHTGLGRARLAAEAARAVAEVAAGHAAVEFDMEAGERGDRQSHVRGLLCELAGAEDALVVNNCAGAVFLALAALCSGRGVVLSRGQMVEIGGSFRMPDIVRQSGCRLIEVGCTNKTRLGDYRTGDEDVAAILRCHPSNFRMVGFVEEPTPAELATFARENGWLMIDDVGSGTLVDTSAYGLPKEPTLQDSLRAGADLVLSSGDKMLGGPQAGLVLGTQAAVSAVRSHPLARALRVDKLTLAALEATLRLYVEGRRDEIPTLRYLSRPAADLKKWARRLASAYSGDAVVEPGLTEVGGGSIPGVGIPTFRAGFRSDAPADMARRLRLADPAILGRIERDRFWLDPRTMDRDEVEAAARALRGLSHA